MGIKILLWYDVEDYITTESEDALLELIKMMDLRDIRGTFKLVGEKVRRLKEHGRTDILERLKRHEIGYHTDFHSQHPTVSEYLEYSGFKDGAIEFERRELQGLKDIINITGMMPVTYGQPGSAWAPQVYPALLKWNIHVYLDVYEFISIDKKPFWFGGVLNITDPRGVLRMELIEDGLEKAKKSYDILYEKASKDRNEIVSIYYHPCEFATKDFWDKYNFSYGINTPEEKWKKPPVRSREEMRFYIERLGDFLDYIISKDDVDFVTAGEILHYEIKNKTPITGEEVKRLASNVYNELSFDTSDNRTLSASEIFSLFSRYLNGQELTPELIYGPENQVDTEVNERINVHKLIEATNIEYPDVFGHKQLPDYFITDKGRINPVDMTCTLAKIIREDLREDDEISIIRGTLKSSHYINEDDNLGKKWIIFPTEFRAPNIIRTAKLQSWTLKPAIF